MVTAAKLSNQYPFIIIYYHVQSTAVKLDNCTNELPCWTRLNSSIYPVPFFATMNISCYDSN